VIIKNILIFLEGVKLYNFMKIKAVLTLIKQLKFLKIL